MKKYGIDKIRNVGFFGHGGTGKTSTCEAMLFNTKAIDRLGKVTEGTTVSDFDPDETKRGMSIYTTHVPVEYDLCKLNILDTPGFLDFVGQIQGVLRVVETGVFFLSAQAGVEVGLERVWKMAEDINMSRFFFINCLDKENADFLKALESIDKILKVSGTVVPIQLPIGKATEVKGIVDLVEMCAYTFNNGTPVRGEIPADVKAMADQYREKLAESAAGTDENLIEKFFDGKLTQEDIVVGLAKGIKTGTILPVLCGSAFKNIGATTLMDALAKYAPAPDAMGDIAAVNPSSGEEIRVKPDPADPVSALVFKTTTDPYVGRLSVLKICSGTLKPDSVLYNANKETDEKVSGLMVFRGKNHENVEEAVAGDIITVAKLSVTGTSDTLCAKERPVKFPPIKFQDPLMSMAVYPKSKGDEDKLSVGIAKMIEEDPTFKVHRDTVTRETIISGVGDLQLLITVDKLKRKFGVEVDLQTPKVAYKETIKGATKVEHKYKKQTGGRGQYGHVCLELDSIPQEKEYEFVDKIVGGVVPKNFIPSVDKGVRKAMTEGVLAGYPVVGVRAALYFGSYHTVDSSDMAFQIAASMAFKKGIPDCKPILLEPIYELEVIVPESFMGDVIGDMNSRRGRILGMDPLGDGQQSIKALVPQAEIQKYAIDLRSLTQGRGTFSLKFFKYEEVPAQVAEPIIEAAKKEKQEES